MIAPLAALLRLHELETGADTGGVKDSITSKDRLVQSLDDSVVQRYAKVMRRYGQTAVVPVERGVCMGCYMRQPSQSREVGEDIYQCQNCGRLLYEPDDAYELSVG